MTTDKERRAEQKKEDGNAAFQKNDFENAVRLYSEAIELNDLNHLFYANRAAAYLVLKKYEDARADAKKCIALDASFTKAYLRLATAERALGNLQAALKAVTEGMSHFDSSGKKAKKSGHGDFKKLEKELKAELNPVKSPRSDRSSVEQAIRQNLAADNKDAIQAGGEQLVSAAYKLQDLQGRMVQRSRQQQEKDIIYRTLEQELAGQKPVTYRRMGKAYLFKDCQEILTDLKSEMQGLQSEVQSLKKGEGLLKRNLDEADSRLKELLKRRQ